MEGGGVLAVPVVFLCLGSLGDVLPLLFVARAGAGAGSFITFITHALYQQRLAPYLLDPTIHFTALPFPPLPPPDAGPEHIQSELEACLDACKAALLLGGGDAHASRPPPPSPRRGLLCANLVAKFAWHIAEVLDVPFLLLAPSIPPPGPAPSAATIYALVGDDAVLQRLRLADRGRASDDAEDDDGDGIRYQRRPIGMAELGHWMLSLLLPPYREFRRRHGLPESFLPASADDPLPDAAPLLYGVSSYMHPKPGYYPRSAHFCGSWTIDDDDDTSSASSLRAAGLEDLLRPPDDNDDAAPPTLICVDMGSMAEVGMGVDWRGLAIAAVRAVAACRTRRQDAAGLRLLLLHFPATIEAALRRAGPDDEAEQQTQAPKRARREDEPAPEPSLASSWVHVLPPEAFVPHAVLFPRCRAVVHHGGLGTTVACIRYGGPPQLVVPCTEEQAMWGAVVAYKGMGLAEGLSLRRGEEGGGVSTAAAGAALAAALARLLDEEDAMRAAAAQVRAAMAGEDGVGTAVRVLEEMIDDEQARS